jgi:cell volume regulation protein A
MTDTQTFAELVLLTSSAGVAAVLASRLGDRLRVPVPALFLAGSALAAALLPGLEAPPHRTVERVVTVALLLILFDGGMHIGWSRFRQAAAPIAVVGVLGTFLTVAATAVLAHLAFGLDWYVAVLVATAVSPTDPAVVFSVLGQRQIAGRSSTILEGESGANDPVGIALMASLLAAGGLGAGAFGRVGLEFLLQMAIGGLLGLLGGRALLWFMRRVELTSEGLYPLRSLATVLLLFGLTTVLHGSGFLAVFAAGIVIGDGRAPFKREVERFHAALASLGEIVAFVALGLTVDLHQLSRADVWVPGLVIGVVLAVAIRPLLVGLCLIPARLQPNERNFVLFAGLKGAVPILLGSLLLTAPIADAERMYAIVIVVVAFSVLVQGSLVPSVAGWLKLSISRQEPQPWALGVRLRDEPEGVHRLTIGSGAPADGRTLNELTELAELPDDIWVSFVVRNGQLLPVHGDTALRAADEVLVLADPRLHPALVAAFEGQPYRLH